VLVTNYIIVSWHVVMCIIVAMHQFEFIHARDIIK
jgi:hypothetical protein